MSDRIEPIGREPWPAPVARVERAARRDPREDPDREPPEREPDHARHPTDADEPDDGRPHIDVRA
jgi:hypothetical protein